MEIEKRPVEFKRDPEDYATRYANNSYMESTIWDFKIIFGQTDVADGPNVVIQHTAITMPWPYVKIFSYLLQSQIAAREAEDGHIPCPTNILIPPPDKVPEGQVGNFKHLEEQVVAIKKVWNAFVEANPELKA